MPAKFNEASLVNVVVGADRRTLAEGCFWEPVPISELRQGNFISIGEGWGRSKGG